MLLLASALALPAQAPVTSHPQPPSPSEKHHYLMSESLDLVTLETNKEDSLGQEGAQNADLLKMSVWV